MLVDLVLLDQSECPASQVHLVAAVAAVVACVQVASHLQPLAIRLLLVLVEPMPEDMSPPGAPIHPSSGFPLPAVALAILGMHKPLATKTVAVAAAVPALASGLVVRHLARGHQARAMPAQQVVLTPMPAAVVAADL